MSSTMVLSEVRSQWWMNLQLPKKMLWWLYSMSLDSEEWHFQITVYPLLNHMCFFGSTDFKLVFLRCNWYCSEIIYGSPLPSGYIPYPFSLTFKALQHQPLPLHSLFPILCSSQNHPRDSTPSPELFFDEVPCHSEHLALWVTLSSSHS
jgi:hypothetical protein